MLLYDRPSLDITNYQSVESLLSDSNPAVVINAAAYTNVEKAEDDEDTAFLVNALGAQNLALACHKSGANLVHISTDYARHNPSHPVGIVSGSDPNTKVNDSDNCSPRRRKFK